MSINKKHGTGYFNIIRITILTTFVVFWLIIISITSLQMAVAQNTNLTNRTINTLQTALAHVMSLNNLTSFGPTNATSFGPTNATSFGLKYREVYQQNYTLYGILVT
jgi:ABC-type transport system involved in cytochrome bd biosynthesis fused ATPase/permease subunit